MTNYEWKWANNARKIRGGLTVLLKELRTFELNGGREFYGDIRDYRGQKIQSLAYVLQEITFTDKKSVTWEGEIFLPIWDSILDVMEKQLADEKLWDGTFPWGNLLIPHITKSIGLVKAEREYR